MSPFAEHSSNTTWIGPASEMASPDRPASRQKGRG